MQTATLRIEIVHTPEVDLTDALQKRQDRLEAILNDHDDTLTALIDRMAAAEQDIAHTDLHVALDIVPIDPPAASPPAPPPANA